MCAGEGIKRRRILLRFCWRFTGNLLLKFALAKAKENLICVLPLYFMTRLALHFYIELKLG